MGARAALLVVCGLGVALLGLAVMGAIEYLGALLALPGPVS